jgi:hypothetical protein
MTSALLDVRCPVSPLSGALEGEITGLGAQRNHCVGEHGVRKPAQHAQRQLTRVPASSR